MPARSKVLALPRDVKRRLDELLVEKGFSDYRGFAKWLTEQGHPMSHMAVQRYGSQFERRIESIRMSSEMAAALVAASPDDPGVVADASIQLVQERMFQVLLASEGGRPHAAVDRRAGAVRSHPGQHRDPRRPAQGAGRGLEGGR